MESNEVEQLKEQLQRLERELAAVRQRVQAIEARDTEGGTREERPGAAPPPPVYQPPKPGPPREVPVARSIPPIPKPPGHGKPAPIQGAAQPPPIPSTRPAIPPREPGPVAAFFSKAWRAYGPPADLSWEMALGTWWLPRIGVVVLGIAVVWLLTLFMGQLPEAWWPYLRLGIGAIVCLGLLGAGKWLEGRHADYARVLMSGGIAMSYLVIYATHYIEYTRIVDSPIPTLMLLAALTALWFSVSALRRSWLLAMFVTAAGHATVALSTLTLTTPHPTAIVGLLALAAGTAAFLPREGWRLVAFAGILGSYANYFLWLANSPPSDALSAFMTAMAVLAAFFALYLLADFFQPELQRARFRPRWLYASVNTAGLVVLGHGLMRGFPFTVDELHLFYFAAALGLAAIAAAYAFLREGDRIYDLFIAKASLLAALGLIELFDGRTLTVALALEALVLLALSMRQGLASTRALGLLAAVAAFTYGVTVTPLAWVPDAELMTGPMIAVVVSVAAFLAMAALYAKADWQRHARPPVSTTLWWQPFAVELEWVRAGDGKIPKSRHIIAMMLAVAGALLLYFHAGTLVPRAWVPALLANAALVLAVAAAAISLPAWSVAALVSGGIGASAIAFGIVDGYPLWPLAAAIGGLMALALTSERQYFGPLRGLAPLRVRGIGPVLYIVAALLALALVASRNPGELDRSGWMAAGAAIALGLTFVLHPNAWRAITASYLAAGAIFWLHASSARGAGYFIDTEYWYPVTAGLVVIGFAAERLFKRPGEDWPARECGSVALIAATAVLFAALAIRIEPPWHAPPHALLAFVLLAWAARFPTRTAASLSVLVALVTTGWVVLQSADGVVDTRPMLAAFASVIVYWGLIGQMAAFLLARGGVKPDAPGVKALEATMPFLASALLIGMLYWLPAIPNNYTSIAWTLAAFSLFGVSLALHQKYYRYAGLTLIFLVLARVFIVDTAQLEPAYRIAAGGLLGIVMCVIGYGYVRARQQAGGGGSM